MNGEIVPVKEVVSPGRGVHYEVYNSNYPDKEHHLVSWDGRRWVFERPTSVHVSSSLETQITSDMFTHNIDVTHLSSPDKNGLRWDENNNSYLNVKNQFIRVKKVGNNRFLLIKTVHDPKMVLRLKNNQFYKENLTERLDNILKVGLSGKERKTALNLLKDVDGYTESSARELLSEYNFNKSGVLSDYSFALEIKSTGKPTLWSKIFKKNKPLNNISSQSQPAGRAKLNLPNNKAGFNLGDKIGEGVFGEIFVDADDNRYLIKLYKSPSHLVAEKIAKHETEMF
ncbi:hypothetical protein CS369_14305 [Candidatus Symbiopectobacterium sp. 'North America']|nr:hypothetical protein [Candidatus Symbiopectobacterium sp. 'North America']